MTKAIVLALAALCASAWAAPARAGEFSYGGFMRFRYITGNPGTLNELYGFAQPDETANIWEYRIRQFFNFEINEHVTTNVKFEWNSQFGDERVLGGGSGDLQLGGGAGLNTLTGAPITNEFQFRIKNAFVRFDIPGAPVTFTVGHQDFSTPKAIISVEDGTGVKAAFKALGGDHVLFWNRPLRGPNNQAASDDADWFGFVPAFQLAGISLSPHISYVTVGSGAEILPDSDVWFVGVDSSGMVGPVNFTADFIVQTGEVGTGGVGCTGTDCDLFSWVLDASGTLDVGPGALTLKVLYSPGDDDSGDGDLDAWQQVISSDMGWSPFFHDGASITNFAGTLVPGFVSEAGNFASGIMAAGAEFALSPFRDVTVTPNAYYLMAAEDNPTNGEDFYGVEAGVQAIWRVWDAVDILAEFDYLFAGDFFEPVGGDAEDAWRVIIGPSVSW